MGGASRLRLTILGSLVVLVAVLVVARLYQVQLHMCDRFRTRARDQHQNQTEVPAIRGAILDRHGKELAASMETVSLFAHPQRVEDPSRAATLLAPVLHSSRAKIFSALRCDKSYVYLKRFLAPETVEAVRTLDLPLGSNRAFGFEAEHRRTYPGGRLAVHVVGFANIDGDGVEGIEKVFDDDLKGDPAIYLDLQDGRSGRVRELILPPKKEPRDVVLTLDIVLQHIVERELDRAIRETGARAASAVLLDPATGEVLALANRPAADLADYPGASDDQRINRAVVHYYEPGSTFKIVVMAAALDRGRVRIDQRLDCENGVYTVGRRTIHDTSPHGMLTLTDVLVKSSNICMVKIAQSLSRRELRDSMVRFGFGARTEIELPGESPGRLAAMDEWSGQSQASLAFGQEIGVTVLQMAAAVAAIANDGMLAPPRVVLGTRDPEGRFYPEGRPRPEPVISARTAHQLTAMMEAVVERGTGSRAAVSGYRVAGKSGTAQKVVAGRYSKDDYMASFGGFAPVGAPRVACLVVIDSPRRGGHQGGKAAAPVFARIMTDALRHLRVPSHRNPPVTGLPTRTAAWTPAAEEAAPDGERAIRREARSRRRAG